MKKIRKISITAMLALCLMSLGAVSVSAALANYESEPNNYYDTANDAVLYEWDYGTNYGYLSTMGDLDYWKILTNSASYYNISLYAPSPYLEYNVVILEKVPGQDGYTQVGRSYSINGIASLSIPGVKSNGTIPQYYAVVYCNNGFHNAAPYKLIIDAVY
ncbi:hypothetical protein D3C76_887440 [compost metagenome]